MISFSRKIVIALLCATVCVLFEGCSPSSYIGKGLKTENFNKMFRNHEWIMKTIRAVYADGSYGEENLRSHWVPPVNVSFISANDSLYEIEQNYAQFPPIVGYRPGKAYKYDGNTHVLSLENLRMRHYEKLKLLEVVYITNDSMQCIGPVINDVLKDSLAVKSLIEFKAHDIPSDYRDKVHATQDM